MFTQISAGSRRRTSTMRSVPERCSFDVITAGMPLFSQNAKTSSASVATSSRSRHLARRARSYTQASIGRPQSAPSTLRGPRLGEDAAVIDWGDRYLVAKTDPITFTAERLGWYAVNINANDVATLGARPRWFLATLLLPERRTTPELARRIFCDTLRACHALGVTLCGGHTEVTAGLDRPVLVGQMLGEVEKSRLVRKESQQPGDLVILTKGVAIEGTSILAREKAGALRRKLGDALLRRARRLLFSPGISVVRDARLAAASGGVRAMHDPTEGGLLAGLYELARAGRAGLRIQKENVPVLKETLAFSRVLGFDPLALIASGALLVVAGPPAPPRRLGGFSRHKNPPAGIGGGWRGHGGNEIIEQGRARPARPPPRDQEARLLGGC